MAQWLKLVDTETDDFNSIPWAPIVEGQTWFMQAVLWPPPISPHIGVFGMLHTHTL